MEKNTYGQSIMRTGSCNNRNKSIDIAKGLLILCVVIGHGTKSEPIRFYVSFSYAFVFDFIRMLFEKGRRCRNVRKNEGNAPFDTIFDLYGDRFSDF